MSLVPQGTSPAPDTLGQQSTSTVEPNSYYEAAVFIKNFVVYTQDECKAQCLADDTCRVWSYCPGEQAQG
jgi:hypothetical protein